MDAHRASTEARGFPSASAAAKSASLAAASAYTHPFSDIRQAVHILGPAAYSALALELDDAGNQNTGDSEISRAVGNINDDIIDLLRNYPARSEGRMRIEHLLYDLDHRIRLKKNDE